MSQNPSDTDASSSHGQGQAVSQRLTHLIASTVKFQSWGDRVRIIDSYRGKPHSLRDEFALLVRILKAAAEERALLLNSSSGRIYPDVLACVLLGFVPRHRRPRIAIMGDMWEPNDGLRGAVEKLVIRLADRAIARYLVLSKEELTVLPRLWGISKDKVRLCPYHYSDTDHELTKKPSDEGHIFAGGDSARDYETLVDVARLLPAQTFVLATHWTAKSPLPPNVRVGPVRHAEYMQLLRTARICVVPIQIGLRRSVGQQTYLNSMYLRKPTIVADGFAVRTHMTDGKDGLIVDGTVEDYARAINWVLDAKNRARVEEMRESAHRTAVQFPSSRTAECLFMHTAALLEEQPYEPSADQISAT